VQNRLSKITLICNKGNEDDMAINNWRLKTLCEPVKKKNNKTFIYDKENNNKKLLYTRELLKMVQC
jgi:hypothetical protein